MNHAFSHALTHPDAQLNDLLEMPEDHRLDIYRNNVLTSWIDCLGTTFPCLKALVGDDFFTGMTGEYARATPPTSPLLHAYGQDFSVFIKNFPPAEQLPFLPDMAQLEWQFGQTHHVKNAEPLSHQALSAYLNDPQLGDRLAELHPSVKIMRFDCQAGAIWLHHQGLAPLPENWQQAEWVLMARDDRPEWPISHIKVISETDANALMAMQQGQPFAQALSLCANPTDLIAQLLELGALLDLPLPETSL